MPSQERAWSSDMILATHIPQDQGSTSRAATGSTLSDGRVHWMWWQRRDEQRDVVLDVVRVETPQVKFTSEEIN